jgi:hypothetical protein
MYNLIWCARHGFEALKPEDCQMTSRTARFMEIPSFANGAPEG